MYTILASTQRRLAVQIDVQAENENARYEMEVDWKGKMTSGQGLFRRSFVTTSPAHAELGALVGFNQAPRIAEVPKCQLVRPVV